MNLELVDDLTKSIKNEKRYILIEGGKRIMCYGHQIYGDALLLLSRDREVIASIDYRSIIGISRVRPRG